MSRSTRQRLELDALPAELVEVESSTSGALTARVGKREAAVERPVRILGSGVRPVVLVGKRVVALSVGARKAAGFAFTWQGQAHAVRATAPGTASPRPSRATSGAVSAPMPGRVVEVHVQPGERVEAGAPLVVIEAMKMQNALFAPAAGRVDRVLVKEGAAIERGAPLIELILDAVAAP